jgi:hypothetical protein
MFGLMTAIKAIDRNDASRTMFEIPAGNYKKFEAEIEKLAQRSKKAGGWDIVPVVIGTKYHRTTNAKTYEVYLDAPDVQIDGYRFVAKLDHSQETGNIIRMVPNVEVVLPTSYRTVAPNCDHCSIRRIRRDTYVVQNIETGALLQVGSSCLKEMFNTDPRAIAKLAELLGYAKERAEVAAREPEDRRTMTLRDDRCIDLSDYLVNTAAVIRQYGWVSGKAAYESGRTSTASLAYINMLDNHYDVAVSSRTVEIEQADHEVVDAALVWARGLRDKAEMNDYENNVAVVAESQFIEGRAAGIAASIVGVYLMNVQKSKPRAKPADLGDMTAVIGLFERAGSKLKYPKIAIDLDGVGTIVLKMAGDRAKVPGSININTPGSFENSDWYGRIHRDGRFEPNRSAPAALEAALKAFAADPAGIAASHKTGQCCFCSLPLKDERSVAVGYGRTCASNYELPWGVRA